MRIFGAGATGVPGSRIVPLLLQQHHAVAGMTRSAANADRLRARGVEPVVCDVYDEPSGIITIVDPAHWDLVFRRLVQKSVSAKIGQVIIDFRWLKP